MQHKENFHLLATHFSS